jgi:hypothetical protein
MEIEVVDEIMGTGKSFTTLRYIESLALTDKNVKWIYCTEYLSEIESRTKENVEALHLWRTPIDSGDETKTDKLIELLKEPATQLIGITHALLLSASCNKYVNQLIQSKGYKLFLDETIDLINPYNGVLFGDFLKALDKQELSINDPYGCVKWLVKDEDVTLGLKTSTDKLKVDCAKGVVYCAISSGSAEDSIALVEIENDVIFKQFKRVIVATYNIDNTLFDAYLSIKGFSKVVCKDVVCTRTTNKQHIKERIEFISKHDKAFSKLNLSSGWYKGKTKNCATSDHFKLINKTIKSIGDGTGCKGSAHLLGFTVPADRLGKQRDTKKIQPSGYPHTVCSVVVDAKGNDVEEHSKSLSTYIPCNARASNEYADKVVMVHIYNRFANTKVTRYLDRYNVSYSNETFALNELVQWVWRSAIRNGEPIKLAILSPRMRELFITWLNK